MKALIHDGVLQYIGSGKVNIPKPTTTKWVDVIYQEKPIFDKSIQSLKKITTTNEDDVTISYEIVNKDPQLLLVKNLRAIRQCAIDYAFQHYDSLTLDQLNSFWSIWQ